MWRGREYFNSENKSHLLKTLMPDDVCVWTECFTSPILTLTTIQLTQWRKFEEDQNNPNQMAKYFSSPSKSQPSVYSQDEIYYLVGENNSMKKLLTEVLHLGWYIFVSE